MGAVWNIGRLILAHLLASNAIAGAENIELQPNLTWVSVGHGIATLISILLVISGIGILSFLNWGRILAIIAASAKFILGTIEIISVSLSPTEAVGTEQRFTTNVVKVFYVFCVLLTMIYPVIVLVLLQRRSTRELFKS